MSNKRRMRYLWIDDIPDRKRMAEQIGERLGVDIVFRNVKNRKLEDEIADMLKQRRPDLSLIDHFLDASKADGMGISHGSTVAETLREKWERCPIIGITAARKRPHVDLQKQNIYDEMYSYPDFAESIDYLPVIAGGFRSLSRSRITNVQDIINRLKVPRDERNRIEAVLPNNLKRDFNNPTLPSRLFKWVRNLLMGRPGFLYDRLWAATLLGIKDASFNKVGKIFTGALYEGIFASASEPRWWASEIRRILYEKCRGSEGRFPWEVGRDLPTVSASDYSKCYVSREPYPEVVAYVDEESDERRPMRLRYTVQHPKYEKLLFFEEIRMMAERNG